MGTAPGKRLSNRYNPGINFISSVQFHLCVYTTSSESNSDVCFQIYYQAEEMIENWGPIDSHHSNAVKSDICERMKAEGWDHEIISLIKRGEGLLAVGLRSRAPLSSWGTKGIVLIGDAAHPPVPYIGQGAMQAVEDCGVLGLLFHLKSKEKAGSFVTPDVFDECIKDLEKLRVPRTKQVLASSHVLGERMRQRGLGNKSEEWKLWAEVAWNKSLKSLILGSSYDFEKDVRNTLKLNHKL